MPLAPRRLRFVRGRDELRGENGGLRGGERGVGAVIGVVLGVMLGAAIGAEWGVELLEVTVPLDRDAPIRFSDASARLG